MSPHRPRHRRHAAVVGGAIPWFPGGHTDPWDHIESAMALIVTGLREEAEAAFEWSRRTQRPDGSWPMQFRGDTIENADSDSNFAAYIAVGGVWHHHLVTGDREFVGRMWPTVKAALDHVLSMQAPGGEIYWARGESGIADEALLTGCSSIHHGLRCALRLAEIAGDPQPEWEFALYRLGHALRRHPPEVFAPKPEYSMDWYYPPSSGGSCPRNRCARTYPGTMERLRGGRPRHPVRRPQAVGDGRRDV